MYFYSAVDLPTAEVAEKFMKTSFLTENNKKNMQEAMMKTATLRIAWIRDMKPFAKEILTRFPRLQDMMIESVSIE